MVCWWAHWAVRVTSDLAISSFYINLPIGGLAAAIICFFYHSPASIKPSDATAPEKLRQMDIMGTLLVLGTSISFFLALQWAGVTRPWNDPGVVGLLTTAAVLFIAFVFVEWYLGNRAIVQGRFLKRQTIVVHCVFKFLSVRCSCFLLLE